MAAITFDTLKFANTLKEAGVPDKQAEAEAKALKEVFSDFPFRIALRPNKSAGLLVLTLC